MSLLSNIKKFFSNRNNYGGKRSLKNIYYIIIHYTGNDGDSSKGNGNYFKNNIVKASAHYFVDSKSITQSVPDNYVAYSVGGSKYPNCSKTGGGKFYGRCCNSNSISIELCDDNRNGTVYPTKETIENALLLTRYLMKKYNIPQKNVIRHFDVNGKACPAYWCGTAAKNAKWKECYWNKIKEKPKKENNSKTFKVKTKQRLCIFKDDLKTRTGIKADVDVYTIMETKYNGKVLYGRLKSGAGWIKVGKKYVDRLDNV